MEAKKIMLLVWKWRDLETAGKIVDAELLNQAAYRTATEDVSSYEGDLFDRYVVYDQLPNGTTQPSSPPAEIVRTCIHNTSGTAPLDYLHRLVDHLGKEEPTLFAFLHRRDGFGETEVKNLLQREEVDKCFLIGEGRDVVYYREERNSGLLDDDGYFSRREPDNNKPGLRVANNKQKKVFATYFDKVWDHYQHEFRTKIVELKEDLLRHLYLLLSTHDRKNEIALADHLSTHQALYLRVISFIDDSKVRLTPLQEDALIAFGKDKAKAYQFDDLQANLTRLTNAVDEYRVISDYLYELFLTDKTPQRIDSINQVLRKTTASFGALIDKL